MSKSDEEKPVKPITKAQQKLLDAAVSIGMKPSSIQDAVYMARELVQCTLPHKNPGDDKPVWTRKNGGLTLVIQQGYDRNGKPHGFPYGTIPRLLLFWMISQAVMQKGNKANPRRLELGNSLSSFLRTLGLNYDTGGGKRGDAKRLKEQMQSLFRARFSFDKDISQGVKRDGRIEKIHGKEWLDMQIAPQGQFWWSDNADEKDDLRESWIELGEEFYQAITASSVPVDIRALHALKRSPLALDLYAWLTHESYRAHTSKKGRFVSWTCLMKQLGADYSDPRHFGEKARAALKKIQMVYPGLKLGGRAGGLTIEPDSYPAIQPDQARLRSVEGPPADPSEGPKPSPKKGA